MTPCLSKQLVGVDCPGCGAQRALVELMKGHLSSSIQMYPALLLILFSLGLTILHLFFKFKNGALFIQHSFFTTLAIILLSYYIKMY
jgi:Protein of unknown function (DUF2752)